MTRGRVNLGRLGRTLGGMGGRTSGVFSSARGLGTLRWTIASIWATGAGKKQRIHSKDELEKTGEKLNRRCHGAVL